MTCRKYEQETDSNICDSKQSTKPKLTPTYNNAKA